jgi:NAD(P)-dependent dehydrogenase (short-subunit alcohol dehydrogenase family)
LQGPAAQKRTRSPRKNARGPARPPRATVPRAAPRAANATMKLPLLVLFAALCAGPARARCQAEPPAPRATPAPAQAPAASAATPAQDPAPAAAPVRAVLVTGASSGIGRTTTELLAKSGFFVYATARKDDDLQALGALPNVQALRLDVTDQAQIDAAVATVRAAGRGLYALVNNAGIAVLAPLIEVREDDLRRQLDVNVFGPYRVTKAFAPLLIESKGRVLTTGSLSGTVCWAMGGPYTMSKHAVEAFTDVLALELQPFGVHVGIVEPGNYRTEIMVGMRERLLAGGYGGDDSRYRRQLDQLIAQPTDRGVYPEPDDVAAAFVRALTADTPQRRYLVVPNQREAQLTIRAALARVAQLNRGQPFAYDREQLIALLDEALAAAK